MLIYHHHRNITQSLLDKLEDLNLLYRDNDRYFFIGDSNADVEPNFRISVLIQNALFFFTPLILICLILMIFSPPLAIIILDATYGLPQNGSIIDTGCELVGYTSNKFGVFRIEAGAGFFSAGATITLK